MDKTSHDPSRGSGSDEGQVLSESFHLARHPPEGCPAFRQASRDIEAQLVKEATRGGRHGHGRQTSETLKDNPLLDACSICARLSARLVTLYPDESAKQRHDRNRFIRARMRLQLMQAFWPHMTLHPDVRLRGERVDPPRTGPTTANTTTTTSSSSSSRSTDPTSSATAETLYVPSTGLFDRAVQRSELWFQLSSQPHWVEPLSLCEPSDEWTPLAVSASGWALFQHVEPLGAPPEAPEHDGQPQMGGEKRFTHALLRLHHEQLLRLVAGMPTAERFDAAAKLGVCIESYAGQQVVPLDEVRRTHQALEAQADRREEPLPLPAEVAADPILDQGQTRFTLGLGNLFDVEAGVLPVGCPSLQDSDKDKENENNHENNNNQEEEKEKEEEEEEQHEEEEEEEDQMEVEDRDGESEKSVEQRPGLQARNSRWRLNMHDKHWAALAPLLQAESALTVGWWKHLEVEVDEAGRYTDEQFDRLRTRELATLWSAARDGRLLEGPHRQGRLPELSKLAAYAGAYGLNASTWDYLQVALDQALLPAPHRHRQGQEEAYAHASIDLQRRSREYILSGSAGTAATAAKPEYRVQVVARPLESTLANLSGGTGESDADPAAATGTSTPQSRKGGETSKKSKKSKNTKKRDKKKRDKATAKAAAATTADAKSREPTVEVGPARRETQPQRLLGAVAAAPHAADGPETLAFAAHPDNELVATELPSGRVVGVARVPRVARAETAGRWFPLALACSATGHWAAVLCGASGAIHLFAVAHRATLPGSGRHQLMYVGRVHGAPVAQRAGEGEEGAPRGAHCLPTASTLAFDQLPLLSGAPDEALVLALRDAMHQPQPQPQREGGGAATLPPPPPRFGLRQLERLPPALWVGTRLGLALCFQPTLLSPEPVGGPNKTALTGESEEAALAGTACTRLLWMGHPLPLEQLEVSGRRVAARHAMGLAIHELPHPEKDPRLTVYPGMWPGHASLLKRHGVAQMDNNHKNNRGQRPQTVPAMADHGSQLLSPQIQLQQGSEACHATRKDPGEAQTRNLADGEGKEDDEDEDDLGSFVAIQHDLRFIPHLRDVTVLNYMAVGLHANGNLVVLPLGSPAGDMAPRPLNFVQKALNQARVPPLKAPLSQLPLAGSGQSLALHANQQGLLGVHPTSQWFYGFAIDDHLAETEQGQPSPSAPTGAPRASAAAAAAARHSNRSRKSQSE